MFGKNDNVDDPRIKDMDNLIRDLEEADEPQTPPADRYKKKVTLQDS